MTELFDQEEVLRAYDRILPLAKHYRDVLSIHLRELASCEQVIDLGCGTGNLATVVLAAGKRVTAVDISRESCEFLRSKSARLGYSRNLRQTHASITDLTTIASQQFDGASSMIVAHLVGDYDRHVQESYRVLRPGGRFVITARTLGADPELLVESVKESLAAVSRRRMLEVDIALVCDRLLRTARTRSRSMMSLSDATRVLCSAGFRDIQVVPNETQGTMYSLVARKPEAGQRW